MKTTYFITDKQYFEQRNQKYKEYQGWSNSATWCYNLYFFQERENYKAMKNLIRKDGTINVGRAIKLFFWSHIKIDDWCEGDINVNEMLEHFESEHKE